MPAIDSPVLRYRNVDESPTTSTSIGLSQSAHDPDEESVNHCAEEPDQRSRFYGYGVNVETTSIGQVKWGHSGAFYVGTGTAFAMLPGADMGIVALTNASPVGAAEAVTTSFSDPVRTGTVERTGTASTRRSLPPCSSITARSPTRRRRPVRRRVLPAADYVGTYRNECPVTWW